MPMIYKFIAKYRYVCVYMTEICGRVFIKILILPPVEGYMGVFLLFLNLPLLFIFTTDI